MKYFHLFVLALTLLAAACGPTKHLDDKITWQKFDVVAANFPGAPAPGSKPIFLYFKQNNCHYCASMDSIFERPEVAWYVNEHFLPVGVNVDTDLPLHTRGEEITYERLFTLFKMDGFPAMYAFDSTGQVLGMMDKSMSLLTTKQMLVYVNDRHFGKISLADFLKMDGVPKDTVLGIF